MPTNTITNALTFADHSRFGKVNFVDDEHENYVRGRPSAGNAIESSYRSTSGVVTIYKEDHTHRGYQRVIGAGCSNESDPTGRFGRCPNVGMLGLGFEVSHNLIRCRRCIDTLGMGVTQHV